ARAGEIDESPRSAARRCGCSRRIGRVIDRTRTGWNTLTLRLGRDGALTVINQRGASPMSHRDAAARSARAPIEWTAPTAMRGAQTAARVWRKRGPVAADTAAIGVP